MAPVHLYISTACHHDHHELCRLACDYCGAPCVCDHHFIEGVTVTEQQPETVDNPAAPDADLDGEPGTITDPEHGVPGDAEPLPDGDADNDEDDTEDEDDADLADDDPEDIDDSDDNEVTGDPVADDGE